MCTYAILFSCGDGWPYLHGKGMVAIAAEEAEEGARREYGELRVMTRWRGERVGHVVRMVSYAGQPVIGHLIRPL